VVQFNELLPCDFPPDTKQPFLENQAKQCFAGIVKPLALQ
jgi:hypothetical protein